MRNKRWHADRYGALISLTLLPFSRCSFKGYNVKSIKDTTRKIHVCSLWSWNVPAFLLVEATTLRGLYGLLLIITTFLTFPNPVLRSAPPLFPLLGAIDVIIHVQMPLPQLLSSYWLFCSFFDPTRWFIGQTVSRRDALFKNVNYPRHCLMDHITNIYSEPSLPMGP